jgi:hypothetical protein
MIKMLKSSNNIYLVYDFLSGGSIRQQIQNFIRNNVTEG